MNVHQECPSYLFVLPWPLSALGGVNQVVINLARQMEKHGAFRPIVLISDWDAVRPVWQTVHGLRTVRWRIRPYGKNMDLKRRFVFSLWERRFRTDFKRFCRENRVEVINPHFPGRLVFTLSNIIKDIELTIPLIVSFHGSDLSDISAGPRADLEQWRELLENDCKVVACSHDLKDRITKVFGPKVVPLVIHNGLDASGFVGMVNTEPKMCTNGGYILSVGKFEEKKGLDVLIKAFAAIAKDYADVTLVLVGVKAGAFPTLQALCLWEGVSERVCFFVDAPHHQVAQFFAGANIFALPSREEPFGIVLLEAGAFSLPVVASRVGGIPEIITDGITGCLVEPGNPSEMASCLRSLLDSPKTAEDMGARLHTHVLSKFKWTKAYEEYIDLAQNPTMKEHAANFG